MSDELRRPLRPRGTPDPSPPDGAPDELDEYLHLTAIDPEPGFVDRVMAAVEAEPTPRRGLLGWAGAAWSGRRLMQATVLAGALTILVAGLILAGSLFGVLRTPPASTIAPIVSPSPSPSPTPTPVPSQTSSRKPSGSPTSHASSPETPEPSHTPEPSGSAVESPSNQEASDSSNPQPSSSEGASSGGSGRD